MKNVQSRESRFIGKIAREVQKNSAFALTVAAQVCHKKEKFSHDDKMLFLCSSD